MSDTTTSIKPDHPQDELLWGITAISKEIKRGRAVTRSLLEHGAIPATNIGDRWVSTRNQLRRALGLQS